MAKIVKGMSKNLNRIIIERLISDSEVPIEEIASECKVSSGTIRNRISHLSESNVIIGYKARARLGQLGMSEAIVGLDIAPENYVEAMNALKGLDFVKELYRSSGDHSAMAIVVSDAKNIDDRLRDITSIKGVRKAYPSFVQETLK